MDKNTKSGTALARTTAISPNDVQVQLSPEMIRRLARLEAHVADSKHFSTEILENLQEYASGKPFSSVSMALTGIATITQETMNHVNATGDNRALAALDHFVGGFHERHAVPPFTLVSRHGKSR
jgi:hypothetical protein